jgi:ABC-type glycerol-3-phosphate transport system permease component
MNAMEVSLRSRGNLSRWFGYLVLAFFAIISLFPIWIAVKTALSDSKTLFSSASSFLPQDPTFIQSSAGTRFGESGGPATGSNELR